MPRHYSQQEYDTLTKFVRKHSKLEYDDESGFSYLKVQVPMPVLLEQVAELLGRTTVGPRALHTAMTEHMAETKIGYQFYNSRRYTFFCDPAADAMHTAVNNLRAAQRAARGATHHAEPAPSTAPELPPVLQTLRARIAEMNEKIIEMNEGFIEMLKEIDNHGL